MNVSVSGNAKTGSSQPQAMGLANTGTTGKKRKSEPQVSVSTLTQDAEEVPLPPKKKTKASVEPSQQSATTTATERNSHDAPSKTQRMDNSAKKRHTGDESNDASVDDNLAHPAKKAKVGKMAALTREPQALRRSGKIILSF